DRVAAGAGQGAGFERQRAVVQQALRIGVDAGVRAWAAVAARQQQRAGQQREGGQQTFHAEVSGKKIDSMLASNSAAIRNASGRLGSYLPVSIALTVCLDTSRRSPSCACDQPRASRSSRTRLFIANSFVAPGDEAPGDA